MAMPSINNVQSGISGVCRIFVVKSSETSDKKSRNASTKGIYCPLLY